jgi:hypothetical protein
MERVTPQGSRLKFDNHRIHLLYGLNDVMRQPHLVEYSKIGRSFVECLDVRLLHRMIGPKNNIVTEGMCHLASSRLPGEISNKMPIKHISMAYFFLVLRSDH